MSKDQIMVNNKIMIALKEILANKDIIQKARESNFDKEVQVRDELERKKVGELELIILRNRYFGRSDRDTEGKK